MSMVGKVVYIAFWDHSMSDRLNSGPIVCAVFGRVTKEDEWHYEVTTWELLHDTDSKESNEECFSVVKGAILEMKELREYRTIVKAKKAKSGAKILKGSKNKKHVS